MEAGVRLALGMVYWFHMTPCTRRGSCSVCCVCVYCCEGSGQLLAIVLSRMRVSTLCHTACCGGLPVSQQVCLPALVVPHGPCAAHARHYGGWSGWSRQTDRVGLQPAAGVLAHTVAVKQPSIACDIVRACWQSAVMMQVCSCHRLCCAEPIFVFACRCVLPASDSLRLCHSVLVSLAAGLSFGSGCASVTVVPLPACIASLSNPAAIELVPVLRRVLIVCVAVAVNKRGLCIACNTHAVGV